MRSDSLGNIHPGFARQCLFEIGPKTVVLSHKTIRVLAVGGGQDQTVGVEKVTDADTEGILEIVKNKNSFCYVLPCSINQGVGQFLESGKGLDHISLFPDVGGGFRSIPVIIILRWIRSREIAL